MDVIVIGAGASGLMAAIIAAKNGANVTLIEAQKKTGKKLSITGNGKCNFTNYNLIDLDTKDKVERYYYGNADFIGSVLERFGVEDTIHFFENLGVQSYVEKNYNGLYPKSNQASSVTNTLTDYARELNVKIKTNNIIHSISKDEDKFCVNVGIDLYAHRVVVATGGYSEGIDGMSGYDIATQFGHKINEIKPALTALVGKDMLNKAAGVRINGHIFKESGEKQTGELQITDYGISGIPVFNLSHTVQEGETIYIDFLTEIATKEGLDEFVSNFFGKLRKHRPQAEIEKVLSGTINEKLLAVILRKLEIPKAERIIDFSENEFRKIFVLLKKYSFNVEKRREFSFAQVTQGGISLDEIDKDTMESKKCKGLYFVGEILDVDGICGGYNLQWAWSTGYIAGESINK